MPVAAKAEAPFFFPGGVNILGWVRILWLGQWDRSKASKSRSSRM